MRCAEIAIRLALGDKLQRTAYEKNFIPGSHATKNSSQRSQHRLPVLKPLKTLCAKRNRCRRHTMEGHRSVSITNAPAPDRLMRQAPDQTAATACRSGGVNKGACGGAGKSHGAISRTPTTLIATQRYAKRTQPHVHFRVIRCVCQILVQVEVSRATRQTESATTSAAPRQITARSRARLPNTHTPDRH